MSTHTEQFLAHLEWRIIRRLDGLLQGDYRTLMRGAGLDLADLREYQHHDDVRHIDWNVTARLQTPHVRQFTEDREMAAWFLVDLSPSVDFGSRDVCKRTLSVEFVAVLARLLMRHGNRIGALLYRTGAIDGLIPPGNGRRHILHILHGLLAPAPAPRSGVTELAVLLDAGLRMIQRRSSIFVLSDFISQPGWEKPLAQLTRRHDVLAVRVVDPLERVLPDLGMLVMQDAETGEQLTVDTHNAAFRRRFAMLAQAREAEVHAAFASAGVDALELSTDGDLVDALVRFAQLRKHRLGRANGRLPRHLQISA